MERLEDRTLPSSNPLAALLPPGPVSPLVAATGQLGGTAWDDLNGNGMRQADEPGRAGVTIYLDQNSNDRLDPGEPSAVTGPDGAYVLSDLPPGTYSVAEVVPPGAFQTFPAPSPAAELFRAGFSDAAGNPIAQGFTSTGPLDQWHLSSGRGSDAGHSPGSSMYFGAGEGPSGGGQYSTNADGTLTSPMIDLTCVQGPVFLDFNHFMEASPGDATANVSILVDGVTTVIADNNVMGSFTNGFAPVQLDITHFVGHQIQVQFRFQSDSTPPFEGWYIDDVVVRAPSRSGRPVVSLAAGQTITGIDFGNVPGPDLLGSSFTILPSSARWGDPVTVHYTVQNQGGSDAGPFDVELRLSSSDVIDATGLLLGTTHLSGLAAGASADGTLVATLPGAPGDPPASFTEPENVLVGLRNDPGSAIAELDKSNNANRGDGLDRAPLAIVAPDLVGQVFSVAHRVVEWGGTVTLHYSLQNRGNSPAGSFAVAVRASADNAIDSGDLLLATFVVPGLAGGDMTSGSLTVTLPGASASPPAPFVAGADLFVGLQIDTTNAVIESDETNNSNNGIGIDLAKVATLGIFHEAEPNDTITTANSISPNSLTTGTVDPAGDVDFFRLTLNESGRLTLQADATPGGPLDSQLALYGPDGRLVIVSDDHAPGNREPRIVQHLPAGTYYVAISASNPARGLLGEYELRTSFQPALDPFERIKILGPKNPVIADFNGDGIPDLAVLDSGGVAVLLGLGDGTFAPPIQISVPQATAMVVGDFNRDGIPDLALAVVSNQNRHGFGDDYDVMVLTGAGDGTFYPSLARFPVGQNVFSMATGDFNGDGLLDVATANINSQDVSVLFGRGDGTFQSEVRLPPPPGDFPSAIAAGDFNGDGLTDLATVNEAGSADGVSVYLSSGHGMFQSPVGYAIGDLPNGPSLVAGDFTGEGRADLATGSGVVLLSAPDGTFSVHQALNLEGTGPTVALTVAEMNGDGRADLVALLGSEVVVFQSMGDGSFQVRARAPVASSLSFLTGLAVVDLNGDHLPDVVITEDDVTVLLGLPGGGFQAEAVSAVSADPAGTVIADLNNDGVPDLATVGFLPGDVSVLLGRGEGTFQEERRTPAPLLDSQTFAKDMVAGDFNRDGRLDLAVAYAPFAPFDQPAGVPGNVAVFLGLGDGTFQGPVTYAVGNNPTFMMTADLNHDGLLDLVTVNADSLDISILRGRRDGSFGPETRLLLDLPAGHSLASVTSGDFNGDGVPDLLVTTLGPFGEHDLARVLLATGDGTFQPGPLFELDGFPSVVAGDFNNDGRADVAAVFQGDYGGPDVEASILLSNGDGTFTAGSRFTVLAPRQIVEGVFATDLNNDGREDLVLEMSADGFFASDRQLLFLDGRGDGTFAPGLLGQTLPAFIQTAFTDINGDGRLDLVGINTADQVQTYLSRGDGTFFDVGRYSVDVFRPTPLLADLNGDGTPDAVVLDRSGRILVRLGRPGEPGSFDPPTVLASAVPARAMTLVHDGATVLLASIDQASQSPQGDTVSLYTAQGELHGRLTAGRYVSQIASADLNGDGFGDLVVANAFSNTVSIFLGGPHGSFTALPPLAVGAGPSDLLLTDVDGDGTIDLVVTNQISGDVSIFLNQGGAIFAPESRYRAGTGTYGVDSFLTGSLTGFSRERTASVASGDFNEDGHIDLVTANNGSNSLAMLLGKDGGCLTDPVPVITEVGPSVVRAADFNGDGHLDLAVLSRRTGELAIFLGNGDGTFTEHFRTQVGNAPGGLTIADVNGDGKLDLLVGNDFGDLLTLLGNGDGTFQPYQRLDRNVGLAVADRNHLVFSSHSQDEVIVKNLQGDTSFKQDRTDGILAPGPVKTVDRGGGKQALVVANSGGNNILVYMGNGNGQFDPSTVQSFPAGTDPVGLTVTDVNSDGIPDVIVANKGSNDVSVFLGMGQGANWTLTPGPRLRAGQGPVSTTVATVNGTQELFVANSQSNDVWMLPGRGNGFFSDLPADIRTFSTGIDPQEAVVGNFDGRLGLLTINAGSNDLTFFSDFGPGRSISSGGVGPRAGLEGDFNHDGFSDLIIANNSDGRIAFLLGGPDGPALDASLSRPDLLHPTALALGGLSNDQVQFYVANEARESATLLSFDLGLERSQATTELHPLQGSTLALVPTLLIGVPENAPASEGELTVSSGSALSSFVLGLDRPASGSATGSDESSQDRGRQEKLLAALDQLFSEHLPGFLGAARDSGWVVVDRGAEALGDAALVLRAALAPLGLPDLNLPKPDWQFMADVLIRAGRSVMGEVGQPIRTRLPKPLQLPQTVRPEPLPMPKEEEEEQPALEVRLELPPAEEEQNDALRTAAVKIPLAVPSGELAAPPLLAESVVAAFFTMTPGRGLDDRPRQPNLTSAGYASSLSRWRRSKANRQ